MQIINAVLHSARLFVHVVIKQVQTIGEYIGSVCQTAQLQLVLSNLRTVPILQMLIKLQPSFDIRKSLVLLVNQCVAPRDCAYETRSEHPKKNLKSQHYSSSSFSAIQ